MSTWWVGDCEARERQLARAANHSRGEHAQPPQDGRPRTQCTDAGKTDK